MNVMMKCGHAANATDGDGKPVCVVCFGIKAGATEVELIPPSLEGREAKCTYCNHTEPSSVGLPFFTHQPNQRLDDFFCGCLGWD